MQYDRRDLDELLEPTDTVVIEADDESARELEEDENDEPSRPFLT